MTDRDFTFIVILNVSIAILLTVYMYVQTKHIESKLDTVIKSMNSERCLEGTMVGE